MELWGGGGVPADEGPPLGLSWEVMGERHVCLDEYEGEREQERTPKDSYCSVGCVEPSKRAEIFGDAAARPSRCARSSRRWHG